ncbi:MAG TPA: MFS transporter [Candidatus Dormibacteraeota bacterium]|jgi:MFS family permease|nr:MFS transporter [Candidatus Dormibacteraeota bacterium]
MPDRAPRLGRDFQLFFGGQLLSNLGSSVTLFLLPLVVFVLTGSALNLAVTTAAEFVPYLLFGLVIGAIVDRLPRRRLMILADIARAGVIASIPVLSELGHLHVEWIYGVGFVSSVLTIFFNNAEFAAIPCLVGRDDLVRANGRVSAAYAVTGVIGPLLAGLLLAALSPSTVLYVDAGSFAVSAMTLALIRTVFDAASRGRTRIREDVAEGLRFVLGNPVLRSISAMMALINFFSTSIVFGQLVFFAKRHLDASDSEVGWMYAAGSLGVVLVGLGAGRLRQRWSFGRAALGGLFVSGAFMVAMANTSRFWIGAALWMGAAGAGQMLDINTLSLRQAITPPELLGRVLSVASVLAWSAIPLGGLVGGYAISRSGNVAAVYIGCGVMQMLLAAMFALGPLGHAERYIAFAGPRGAPSQEALPPQVTAESGGPMTKGV